MSLRHTCKLFAAFGLAFGLVVLTGWDEIAIAGKKEDAEKYTNELKTGKDAKVKVNALGELASALESVLRARGQRYLMANVPRASLEAVKTVIPGLNGPTVIDIMNGGLFVAVHAVVPAATIYRTIASLKSLGAEGILVTRIERLMA